MAPRLKIFYHDHCFDGASSAAIFGDFYRQKRAKSVDITLQGMQHEPGDPFAGVRIDGDDNVCLDFRYCADPKMTWWFDHHQSAFQPKALESHFRADDSGQKFHDASAGSCAVYCHGILTAQFGYAPEDPHGHWAELVHWADIIDSARWDSATSATDLSEPPMQVMSFIESNRDRTISHQIIGMLGHRALADIAALPEVAPAVAAIVRQHQDNVELIRARAVQEGDVVLYDLSTGPALVHNKFIVYRLFPTCRFAVGITRLDGRLKVSVGYNPWSDRPCNHNVAALCEQFGGGGHPVVGAVSVPGSDLPAAQRIARQLCERLA